MNSGSSDTELELRRVFAYPRSSVFRAFTRVSSLEQWMAPSDSFETKVLDLDFREGGSYCIRFQVASREPMTLRGVYEKIKPGRQIVYSWVWDPPDPHAGIESRVVLDFRDHKEGTELTVRQERLQAPNMKQRHQEGWEGTLPRLARWLGSASSTVSTLGGVQ